MLLRAMFLAAFLATIAETIVHGCAALARAELHARALAAIRTSSDSAVAAAQSAIANAVVSGTVGAVNFPSPSPSCATPAAQPCSLYVSSSIRIAPTPAPAASPCPAAQCTVYLQGNSNVREDRVTVTIATSVADAAGRIVAQRDSVQSFRIFGTPPYASLDAGADATVAGIASSATGDDGGAPASLVNVEYQNTSSGAKISGNIWRPRIEDPASSAPAWDK